MPRTHFWGVACVVVALTLADCGASTATPAPTSATVAATTAPVPVATTAAPTVALAARPTSIVTPTDDWPALESRPLTLPSLASGAACPVTSTPNTIVDPNAGRAIGQGPVYAAIGDADNAIYYPNAPDRGFDPGWGGIKALWVGDGAYLGPILVRGRQLDGPNEMRFFIGNVAKEMRFDSAYRGSFDAVTDVWREWPSLTLVRAPGCYAYQVDGLTFSYSIVFRATPLAS